MILKFFLNKNKFFKIITLSFVLFSFAPFLVFRKNSAIYGNEIFQKRKTIEWDKININKSNFEINWEKIEESNASILDDVKNDIKSVTQNKKIVNIYSLNRSIVAGDDKSGPDISFLVPLGFKSHDSYKLDFSIRGWNRRPKNSNLFAWNGGDAVAQINYQIFNNNKSSFAINIGLRSVYNGDLNLPGGSTPFGEGLSLGFRWDHKISKYSGLAFGAEQLIHFDSKTDTGRDIYLSYSQGKSLSQRNLYPLAIFTGGFGTGYLALWDKTKFACTDLFGGAGVDVNNYEQLCWGPFGAFSIAFNKKFSTFLEYNNYSFMVGGSYNPAGNLRLTFGITLAESFDDYKIKDFDELRWFSRVSIAI